MNRKTFIGLTLIGLTTPLVPVSAGAESPFSGDIIEVTATRSEQPAEASLAPVSVIERDQIERSQAPDIMELLRLEAGVDVARAGGPGGQTSVFMRGSNSNHVLVLVDGIRVAASGTGGFAWELLDPNIIERIEIVRGPRAARWGSDAIGGVIQIFTRRAEGASARAAYGNYRDRSLTGSFGTGQAGMTISARRVGGFSAQNERGFNFDPDDDGFENISAAGSGVMALGNGSLSWNARVADGDVEFDQGETDTLNYAAGLEYRTVADNDWQYLASLSMYRDRFETETAFGVSEAITRRTQAGLQAERRITDRINWLLGADAWRESGVSRGDWAQDRYNIGAWTGLDGSHEAWDFETSLRVDEDELFGSALTGNIAGGWRLTEALRLRGSIGRGFRAPNFNQLFSPGFGGQFAGNPDLDPEVSLNTEVGLDYAPGNGHRFTASVFENRIDDLIDFSGEDFQAINIEEARIRGVELAHDWSSENWRSRAQITWQDPENRNTDQQLLRRPKEKASVSLDRLLAGGGWIGAESVYTGSRFDVGQEELPSHVLVNLRAGWPLGGGFRFESRLENATDRDYEQLIGFNTAGRSLFVALSWEG